MHEAGVHLVEVDLLRRGQRPFIHPMLPDTHYITSVVRGHARKTEVWGFNIQDKMPVIPIPLVAPDKDVPLDLRRALDMVYERGLYELSIDYAKHPAPPVFSEEEQEWMGSLLN